MNFFLLYTYVIHFIKTKNLISSQEPPYVISSIFRAQSAQ